MLVYGQLEKAQVENLASDPATGWLGRIYYNTGTLLLKVWNGSSWVALGTASVTRTVTGSRASPTLITTSGITPNVSATDELIFVAGNAGPIDITTNPQIVAGAVVGRRLILVGCSDTNTILLENGNGLALNGNMTLDDYATISLYWDGTAWCEECRNRA